MLSRQFIVCVLIASAGAMSSCAKSPTAQANLGCPDGDKDALAGPRVADTSTQPRVKVVNAFCPIAGSHAVGENKMTVQSLTRDYQGKKVGFCCDSCPPLWDAMSDDEKKAAFDAALAREATKKK